MKFLLTIGQKEKAESYCYHHVQLAFDKACDAANAIDALTKFMPKDKDTEFVLKTISKEDEDE